VSLPDFFVFGAPKAGTTALHAALARHPQLFMSSVKEPKFFLCDGPPPDQGGPGDAHSYREWIWRPEEYERLFDDAPPGTLRGESTPFYLSDLAAHQRIRRAVPDARLIIVLRDPVDRAYSNWAHLWADGLETIGDFLTACAEEPRRTEAGWAPFWQYLATGLYGRQLQHLYTLFPRDQVLVIRYMALVDQPGTTLDTVCRFLGVDEGLVNEVPARNVGGYVPPSLYTQVLRTAFRHGADMGRHFPPQVWRKASLPLQWLMQRTPQHRPELAEADRVQLIDYFEEDISIVEEETGWDLTTWRTYRAGGTYSVRKSWAPSRRLVS
jgi:Sulfotransferase family